MKKNIYNKVLLIALSADLSILIILGIAFSNMFLQYSKKQQVENMINRLGTVEYSCDLLLDDILEDLVYFSSNAKLDKMSYALNNTDAENIIIIRDVLQDMQKLINTNDKISSIYLYVEECDLVLTSNGRVATTDEFYDRDIINLYNQKIKDGEGVGKLLARFPQKDSYTSKDELEQNAVISMCIPMTAYTTKLKGYLVVNIHERIISNIINGDIPNDDQYVYLLNSDGEVISHPDQDCIASNVQNDADSRIMNADKESGYFYDSIGGNRMLVLYKKSLSHAFTYIGICSLARLLKQVRLIVWMCIAAILIVAALSALYIMRGTKKAFTPMNKLVDKVAHSVDNNAIAGVDEIAVLTAAFDSIENKSKQMASMLAKNKEALYEQLLMKLLNSRPDTEDTGYALEIFANKYFYVLSIAVDGYTDFAFMHSIEQRQLVYETILQGVKNSLTKYNYICQGIWHNDGSIAVIVNAASDDKNAFYAAVSREHQAVLLMLEQKYGISVSVAASDISEFDGIHQGYEQSLEALKKRMFKGYRSFLKYDECVKRDVSYYYPVLKEKHLFNYLKLGIADKVELCNRDFFKEIRKRESSLSYDNLLQIFTRFAVNTITYTLDNNINIETTDCTYEAMDLNFAKKETIDNVERWFKDLFLSIIRVSAAVNDNNNFISKAIAYIDANYTKDIDLVAMAKNLGVSYSYLRKNFKILTGETLIDYINKIRISKGKKMLEEDDTAVYKIAIKLGYNNDQSFSRFFKKYEGITPGQYRNKFINEQKSDTK